jgi:hypothetical protein
MNIAVVIGSIRGSIHEQVRDDGVLVVSFDVAPATVDDGPDTSAIPCTWFGPPRRKPALEPGRSVTVIGSLRRRFYRRGGATTSRTDLLAERVILGPPSRSRHARARVAGALS